MRVIEYLLRLPFPRLSGGSGVDKTQPALDVDLYSQWQYACRRVGAGMKQCCFMTVLLLSSISLGQNGNVAKDASNANGATPEEKIINAANATKLHLVIVPGTMSGGYDAATPIKSKQLVLDFRGCSLSVWTADCTAGSATSGGALLRNRFAEAVTAPNQDNYQSFQVHLDAEGGGVNASTRVAQKTNFATFVASQRSYTPGQHFGLISYAFNGSNGDTFAGNFQSRQWGNTNARGDEGLCALCAYADQGEDEFTATVSSVPSNVINYSSATAEYSRGQNRYLLVTNRAVYSTGKIINIVNHGDNTATVTGEGTAWNVLCPGRTAPCTLTSRFLSLDRGNAHGVQLYVVRVGSVQSATQLKLIWDLDQYGAWSGAVTSGTYKLFQGSTVTSVAKAGSMTVADGAQFQVSDKLRMPIGNFLGMAAGIFRIHRVLPGSWGDKVLELNNTGTTPVSNGLLFQGPMTQAINILGGTDVGLGLRFSGAPYALIQQQDAGSNSTRLFNLQRSNENGNTAVDFTYDRANSRLALGSAQGMNYFGDMGGIGVNTPAISAGVVNVATGFRIGDSAPKAHCLVGNGTDYVDAVCPSGGTGKFPLLAPDGSPGAASYAFVAAAGAGMFRRYPHTLSLSTEDGIEMLFIGNRGGGELDLGSICFGTANHKTCISTSEEHTVAVRSSAGSSDATLTAGVLRASNCVQVGGTTGPTWCSGNRAPTGRCTTGSLYTRTDTTGGLYVCMNQLWDAARSSPNVRGSSRSNQHHVRTRSAVMAARYRRTKAEGGERHP